MEPLPGGESYTDVVKRVREFFKGLRTAELDGQLMVVIGHRATYYALDACLVVRRWPRSSLHLALATRMDIPLSKGGIEARPWPTRSLVSALGGALRS